jgi:2,3-bisphosphoglycerate-independent phosphoglycerate mutase
LLIRGPGIETPKLKIYKKWLSVAYMPLEIGFSKLSGMKVFSFDYPELKNLDVYENLHKGLEKACGFSMKILKRQRKNFDYAYIHFKETDLPGHDNKPIEKKLMLEYADKTFFKFLRKFAPPNGIHVVVTADHSTPCKLKSHSADPVPVLFYNGAIPKIEKKRKPTFPFSRKSREVNEIEVKGKKFCESEARKGRLGLMQGVEMLRKVGFVK